MICPICSKNLIDREPGYSVGSFYCENNHYSFYDKSWENSTGEAYSIEGIEMSFYSKTSDLYITYNHKNYKIKLSIEQLHKLVKSPNFKNKIKTIINFQ